MKKIGFFKTVMIIFIASLITLSLFISTYLVVNEISSAKKITEEVRTDFIEVKKNEIKRQVDGMISAVSYERSLFKAKAEKMVKDRVYDGYNILEKIYKNSNTKSRLGIEKIIKETLGQMLFNNGRSSYFLYGINGSTEVNAINNTLNNKDKINLITIAKSQGKGYYYRKAASGETVYYIKYFKPLEIFIGTSVSICDLENDLKQKIIGFIDHPETVSSVSDYMFALKLEFNADGTYYARKLANPNDKFKRGAVIPNDLKDSRGELFHKEILDKCVRNGNGFVKYYFKKPGSKIEGEKLSYVELYKPWNWIIGTGVYIDNVNHDIARINSTVNTQVKKQFDRIVVFTAFFIGILLFILFKLNQKLKNEMLLFKKFFKEAASSSKKIDKSKLRFDEFCELANYANTMIDEKVRIEKELIDEKEYLSVTLYSIGDAVIATDEKGKITLMNKVAENLTGWMFSEAKERPIEEIFKIINERSREIVDSPVNKVLKKGEIVMLANHAVLIGRNGNEKSIADSAAPIYDAEKRIKGVVMVFRDVSEIKRKEERIKQQEIQFGEIFDSMVDGIIVTDLEWKIVSINRSACRIFGYDSNNFLRLSAKNIFISATNNSFKNISEKLSQEKSCHIELTGIRENGKSFDVDVTINSFHYNGKPHFLMVARDITEKKKTAARLIQTEKLKSIGFLAGGIAHDFNNILTGILGNINLAELTLGSEIEAFKYLKDAEKASVRATNLTRQLLTFAKGGEPIKELSSLAEVVTDSAKFVVTGSNIVCDFKIENNLWSAMVDKGQISQVIQNLVINSRHAMPEGGKINIEVRNIKEEEALSLSLERKRYIEIRVKDSGMGIPEKYLDKIFDPYFSTKSEGSGLGLAVCHSIITNHNGDIRVHSKAGKGTTFLIYLPSSVENAQKKSVEKHIISKGSGKIILMDDEKMIRDVSYKMLKKLGYDAELAEDGEEALNIYRKALYAGEHVCAVIMDLTIAGGMGGKDTIRELLKIDPHAKAIVSSGYSGDPVMSNYEKYGFKAVIIKPYKLKELGDVLKKVIED